MRIKLKILLFLFPLIISKSPFSQNIITIQPGPSDGFDAFVHTIYPASNFGDNASLIAAAWTYQGDFGIIRSLFRFDLVDIDPEIQIDSAHLSLYYNATCGHEGHGGANSAWIRRVTNSWNDQSVCWNNQPGTTQANQIYLSPSTSITQDYTDINVTTLVQYMISNPSTNYGFQLKIDVEETYRSLTFTSSNHPVDSIRPKLEIYYSCFVDLGNDTTLCNGDSLQISAGSGFTNYLWNTGENDTAIYITTPGVYWVVVSDDFDCFSSDTIIVEYQDYTNVNLGNDTTLCFGETLLLQPGTGYLEYLWQNGSTEMQFTVTEPGTYYVTVQDNCGSGSDTVNIGYSPEINLDLGNDTILCELESIMLTPGSGFANYVWQDGSTAPFYMAQDAGTYWVEVTDGNNCTAEDEIFIDLLVLSVNLGSDTVLCPGTEIILSSDQSFDGYIWLDSLCFDPAFITDSAGIFWVTCFDSVDQKVCYKTDSIRIDQLRSPFPPEIPDEYTICPGEELTIDAGIGKDFNYLWNESLNDSVLFVYDSGLFIISISNVCGTIFDSTSVFFYPSPYVEIIVDTISQNEFFLSLNQGFESYFWSTGITDSSILVNIPGTYWIEVANEFECKATDSIEIEPTDCDIFIPNLLTPNEDLSNDYFFIEGINIQGATILIFNRWGEKVFQSEDKNFNWDGTNNGHDCSEGTYYYIISYYCNNFTQNLQRISRKGTITLLR